MRLSGLVLTGILTLATGPALAGTITPAAWTTFIDESMAQYGDPDPGDFEFQLYDAAKHTKSQAAAVAEFGKRMHLDAATAQDYAELLVDTVAYFKSCDSDCRFAPGGLLYGETARVAMTEPTGKLLFVTGEYIGDDDLQAFIRLVWKHPAAASVFARLYGYDEHAYYLGAALATLPDDPAAVPAPTWMGDSFSGAPDEMDGTVPALLEATEARLADTPGGLAWKAAIAQFALDQELALGLDHEAVQRYLAYPESVRAQLPVAQTGLAADDACRQSADGFGFVDHLAAALWRDGETAEAQALLSRALPEGWRRNAAQQVDLDVLNDAMVPTLPDKTLFSLYVEGKAQPGAPGAAKPKDTCDSYSGSNGDGWLFAVSGETPAVRGIVADRLAKAGYSDMAAWLDGQKVFNDWNRDPAVLSQLTDLLPADVVARKAAWAQRIAAARTADVTTDEPSGAIHVTSSVLPPVWTEKPLPAGIAAWPDEDALPVVPKGTKLPVPADSVLRYEASGKDAAVVYQSSDYDLVGEVPAYGLWLALRRAGAWQRPLYLGLQQYFPYVVTPGSHLPLIAGDRLQLEVQVKEIDPKSIRFPPVDLGYVRQQKGLFLDMALSDLAGDRDGDGMTDIEEAKLGLKPDNRDSDGDGIDDGRDAMPLTAYDANADARASAVARMILERLVGHDAGALVIKPQNHPGGDDVIAGALGGAAPHARRDTVFIVSDKDIFSGIADAPFRLIVYSSDDLKRLGRDKAPFYPPRITKMFVSLDGSDYYVDWSASWVGGSMLIHCDGDVCTSKILSDWIT